MKPRIQTAFCLLLAGFLMGVPTIAANIDDSSSSIQQTGINADSQTLAQADESAANSETIAFDTSEGQHEHDGWHNQHHGPMFTDDQLEKMSILKDKLHTTTAAQKAELQSLHHQMRNLMLQPTVERSQVMALQSKINALRDDLSNRFVNFRLDTMAILTPEQKQEMRHHMLLHSTFAGHHWHHRGHEHGHGEGRCG